MPGTMAARPSTPPARRTSSSALVGRTGLSPPDGVNTITSAMPAGSRMETGVRGGRWRWLRERRWSPPEDWGQSSLPVPLDVLGRSKGWELKRENGLRRSVHDP
jgi:hypothetical protein